LGKKYYDKNILFDHNKNAILLEERQIEDTCGFSCSSLAQTPESHSGRQTLTQ
jgi:hypothetical protein